MISDAAVFNTVIGLAVIGLLTVVFTACWALGRAFAFMWWFSAGVVQFFASMRKVRS